jgi:hypothetical protein
LWNARIPLDKVASVAEADASISRITCDPVVNVESVIRTTCGTDEIKLRTDFGFLRFGEVKRAAGHVSILCL